MNNRPIVAVFDGGIGAGKTSLISLVAEDLRARGLRVCVIPEPVDDWIAVGILQKFYDEPEKYCYPFQTYTVVTRIAKIIEKYEADPSADVYIMERSPETDRYIFVEILRELMGEMHMEMYARWWEMWRRLVPFEITRRVFLNPAVDKCMSRVEKRHRVGETSRVAEDRQDLGKGGVAREYQDKLKVTHEDYYARTGDALVLDGHLADDDFTKPGEAQAAVLDKIRGYFGC